jgi:hypothetical protein
VQCLALPGGESETEFSVFSHINLPNGRKTLFTAEILNFVLSVSRTLLAGIRRTLLAVVSGGLC